jgi:hypothetical protein
MVNSQHFGDVIRSSIVWRCLVLDEGHKVSTVLGDLDLDQIMLAAAWGSLNPHPMTLSLLGQE